MSRPWSRFAARTAAVALLSVGVAGGFYLSEDRQSQRSGPGAQVAGSVSDIDVNVEYRQKESVSRQVRTVRQQATEVRKQAKAAAEKARKAEEAARKKAEEEAAKEAAARAAKPYDGPIPESCEEYSGNRKVGCALMMDAGLKIDQFPCLDKLWNKESGWNHKARNSSSGAYGIPQAYPGNKMSSVADDWETNPVTQIKWGLGYIKGRYSTPCAAWNHSQSNGYY
ncbi:lytic transglycosylase domain-containing protein [Micromonospora sp. HNM0581]|uniref:aggregation-promoting factor C-terminal-like domain-containing protein n=1 Tax=Micromonospora sp. HNM0581 TaxID=2716341 RepID=UPI001469E64F|nr:lytic transglycosylase domain-containing protein [Micromonospora sp. HNM0581]